MKKFRLSKKYNKKGGNITNQDTINEITQEISIYKDRIVLIYEQQNINIDILIEDNILLLNNVSMGYYKGKGFCIPLIIYIFIIAYNVIVNNSHEPFIRVIIHLTSKDYIAAEKCYHTALTLLGFIQSQRKVLKEPNKKSSYKWIELEYEKINNKQEIEDTYRYKNYLINKNGIIYHRREKKTFKKKKNTNITEFLRDKYGRKPYPTNGKNYYWSSNNDEWLTY